MHAHYDGWLCRPIMAVGIDDPSIVLDRLMWLLECNWRLALWAHCSGWYEGLWAQCRPSDATKGGYLQSVICCAGTQRVCRAATVLVLSQYWKYGKCCGNNFWKWNSRNFPLSKWVLYLINSIPSLTIVAYIILVLLFYTISRDLKIIYKAFQELVTGWVDAAVRWKSFSR